MKNIYTFDYLFDADHSYKNEMRGIHSLDRLMGRVAEEEMTNDQPQTISEVLKFMTMHQQDNQSE